MDLLLNDSLDEGVRPRRDDTRGHDDGMRFLLSHCIGEEDELDCCDIEIREVHVNDLVDLIHHVPVEADV